jgi:hypothetical protein
MRRIAVAIVAACLLGAGCGLNVQSPDLFVLTRIGSGSRLTVLVNDGGTIACNGGAAKPLSDPLLLQARDLATALDKDAQAGMRIASGPRSVYRYSIKLQDGTVQFPDTAGSRHSELSRAELFALQAQSACK